MTQNLMQQSEGNRPRSVRVKQTKADLLAECELSGEAIGLVRHHLASVDIHATFVDDAAAMAAARIKKVEKSLAETETKLRYAHRMLAGIAEDVKAVLGPDVNVSKVGLL